MTNKGITLDTVAGKATVSGEAVELGGLKAQLALPVFAERAS